MNALARYLLVFLLGWSGAVFSYSDLIYPKNKAPLNKTLNAEPNEPLAQTNKASSVKELELPPTASGTFIQSRKKPEQPKP